MITDISIRCTGENNLILTDGNNVTIDYCSIQSGFAYYSESQWIGIIKKGKVKFKFKFGKVNVSPVQVFSKLPTTTTLSTTLSSTKKTRNTYTLDNQLSTKPQKTLFLAICGKRSMHPKQENFLRIIGGGPAEPNIWPWQAYITDGRYTCGASLINDQV